MKEFSGPQWCRRWPTGTAISDLTPDFQGKVNPFIATLRTAGAKVVVTVTRRPKERAYLMHWACMVAGYTPAGTNKLVMVSPDKVPPMDGVDIDWTHGGDHTAARAAAAAMVKAYGIVYPAALESRHIDGRAIDMTITWQGTLTLRDAGGHPWAIASLPRTGMHPQLWAIGKTFGVVKLASDPPHWSDDGH